MAFEKYNEGTEARSEPAELADYWFFETVVRLHRGGEGAPYTGLNPVVLGGSPALRAERCIEKGDPKEVVAFLHVTGVQMQRMFKEAMVKKRISDENDVDAAREYVEAMLGFILYSHGPYKWR
ncbi:MAG: DUF6448 family protein [Candidatus Micrarchaeia archaeon]